VVRITWLSCISAQRDFVNVENRSLKPRDSDIHQRIYSRSTAYLTLKLTHTATFNHPLHATSMTGSRVAVFHAARAASALGFHLVRSTNHIHGSGFFHPPFDLRCDIKLIYGLNLLRQVALSYMSHQDGDKGTDVQLGWPRAKGTRSFFVRRTDHGWLD